MCRLLLTVAFSIMSLLAQAQQIDRGTTPNNTRTASTQLVPGAPLSRQDVTPPATPLPLATTNNNSSGKIKTIPAKATVAKGGKSQSPQAPTLKKAETPQIVWLTIEEALEKSKTEKRKLYIDVYTDWCGWCKRMDATTFQDPVLVKYINDKYYAVKFNAEQIQSINFKGKTYNFKKIGERGYHELAELWLNNKMSYPTSVVLDENLEIIQPIPGYLEAAKLDAILHYFGSDSHRTTPWEKYERNFVRGK